MEIGWLTGFGLHNFENQIFNRWLTGFGLHSFENQIFNQLANQFQLA
jgi:hypothetical protein